MIFSNSMDHARIRQALYWVLRRKTLIIMLNAKRPYDGSPSKIQENSDSACWILALKVGLCSFENLSLSLKMATGLGKGKRRIVKPLKIYPDIELILKFNLASHSQWTVDCWHLKFAFDCIAAHCLRFLLLGLYSQSSETLDISQSLLDIFLIYCLIVIFIQ